MHHPDLPDTDQRTDDRLWISALWVALLLAASLAALVDPFVSR